MSGCDICDNCKRLREELVEAHAKITDLRVVGTLAKKNRILLEQQERLRKQARQIVDLQTRVKSA